MIASRPKFPPLRVESRRTRADAGKAGRQRRWYGHVRRGNGYGRGLPRGGGGRRTGVRGRRKRTRRKERDIPRTSVGGASREARTDAARVGDCVALGRTRGRLAAVPHGDGGAGLRVLGGGVLRSGAGDLGLEVGGELEGLGGQRAPGGGRGRGAGRLRAGEGGARTRRRAESHRRELSFFMMFSRGGLSRERTWLLSPRN